jgi:hypothetical protein
MIALGRGGCPCGGKTKRDAENADKRGRTRTFSVFSASISARPRPIALRAGADDGTRVEVRFEEGRLSVRRQNKTGRGKRG